MMFFLNHGYRMITHDRRGHGRSSQPSDRHDMDHYADDPAALTEHLNLKNETVLGFPSRVAPVSNSIGNSGLRYSVRFSPRQLRMY